MMMLFINCKIITASEKLVPYRKIKKDDRNSEESLFSLLFSVFALKMIIQYIFTDDIYIASLVIPLV